MKIIRVLSIGFVGLVAFAACVFLGTMIGFSMEPDLGGLVTAIIGFMIGSVVGFVPAIAAAKFFADYIWVGKKPGESEKGEYQQRLAKELESNDPEAERQRVEKYGNKIVVCSSCETKNSMSFSNCLKCSKDLNREQPVDNPFLT